MTSCRHAAAMVFATFTCVAGASHASAQTTAPPPKTTGTIRGTVVDTHDGTPLHRVSVRLQATGQTTLTDETGHFQFADVAAGDQELYVSAVDFILVKRSVRIVPGATIDVTIALAEGTGTYKETVTVVGTVPPRRDAAVASEQTLRSTALQQLGSVANDPMRAIQALPGVAAGDDFRSEFAIRGAGVQQMNFTFEGVATPFLLHTIQQVHDSASIAMVSSDVLEDVSVSSGAYSQRYGNRTASEIDFRMREGSRERVQSHVSLSLIDASAVVEGPLGSSKRGSWLVAARKSYLDLVVGRLYPTQNLTFGFADAQSKLTYDLNGKHQLQLALTAGHSRFERPALDQLGLNSLRDGDNRSGIAVLSWRYLPSARFVLTQRVAATANAYRNTARDGPDLDSGNAFDVLYRADWSYVRSPGVTWEGGGEVRRAAATGREQRFVANRLQLRESYNDGALAASAYAQARLTSSRGVTIVPGLRVDHWSLTSNTTTSPWIESAWPMTRSLTLRAGAGIYRHEPGFGEVLGFHGTPALRPERAYHADAGVEGRLTPTLRWQATVYEREDRDRLRLPDTEMRLVNGALQLASITSHYRNALDGHARGVEWLIERRTPNGLSGWLSYSLGFNRYQDRITSESFWGDFDQRHTINLYGNYRVSDRLSFSARFRAGSNFPAAGYWTERDGTTYVASERNTLRVPPYSRLDVRMNRTFTWERKRLTLFLEGLNLANRDNVVTVLPSVDRRTFQATRLFETMLPLVPSVGILVEF